MVTPKGRRYGDTEGLSCLLFLLFGFVFASLSSLGSNLCTQNGENEAKQNEKKNNYNISIDRNLH